MAARKKKTSSAKRKGSSRAGASSKKKPAKKSSGKASKKKAVKKKPVRAKGRPAAKKKARAGAARKAKAKPKTRATSRKATKTAKTKAKAGARSQARTKKSAARQPSKAATSAAKAREKKQKERERKAREKEREQQAREKERERKAREKEREQQAREKERERKAREKERERERKLKEREAAQREKEKERARKQKDVERARLKKQKEAERLAKKKARAEEMARRKAEREAERARKAEEKEQLRLEALQKKEEERREKEAEREAYRKAKEVERAKLRAQREAARRALEGKVARATKRANRIGGMGRGATARVYSPDLIPNQSGTTRRDAGLPESKFANLRLPEFRPDPGRPLPPAPEEEEKPPPPPPPPPPERIEDRYSLIQERMKATSEHFQREYQENFGMSWIYHDSALEGVVYTYQELKTAIDPNITVVPDSSLQPVCEEIRRHKAAIDWVRELAERKRVPINIDVIKRLYLLMHPEEGDLKSVKYRKDIPQHRLYFHEYAAPDKIAYKVRQAIDWLNGPEPKKIKNPVRIAARVQYDLLRVFPFPSDSGKVARLIMNLLLLRVGYPPAIIHSTERQRYYEALKGSLPTIITRVNDSLTNGLVSIEKMLDDYERKG
jgi:hypothetical protein